MKHLGFFVLILIVVTILLVVSISFLSPGKKSLSKIPVPTPPSVGWQFTSIDTMKYSRDLARQSLRDPKFDAVIDQQMTNIASTGAKFVAIGTPYDDEFLPIMRRWIKSARAHNLHIWFRGNFSGWEGWFGYSQISKDEHLTKTRAFILNNPDLFADDDIFTSCPECENGDKLQYGDQKDVKEQRKFLIEEYLMVSRAFEAIGINVTSNYYSMNKDAAVAVMDPATTKALGNVIVIDHYVSTPDKLANDVQTLADKTGAEIVLGEFGAPIPDINGTMTDAQQKAWVFTALQKLSAVKPLIGLNYWTSVGGSTALWKDDGTAKPVVSAITTYYSAGR